MCCANGIITEYSTRRWTYLYFGCTFPQEKGIACVKIHRRPKIAPKKGSKGRKQLGKKSTEFAYSCFITKAMAEFHWISQNPLVQSRQSQRSYMFQLKNTPTLTLWGGYWDPGG